MTTNTEDNNRDQEDLDNINSDYNKRVSLGNHPDPSAKRNMGPNGTTERAGQKDKLQNLKIQGDELSGYGGNDSESVEEFAQGPGFEYEGSDTGMDDSVAGIRSGDQPFGEDEEKPNDADHSRR